MHAKIHAMPPEIKGCIFMALSSVFFCFMSFSIKLIGPAIPSIEISFFRVFLSLLFVAPGFFLKFREHFTFKKFLHHSPRGLLGSGSLICGFYALTILPFAEVNSLRFTVPLYTIFWSYLFFHERPKKRRLVASALGFIGVLTIIRPGMSALPPQLWIAVMDGFFASLAAVYIKKLSKTEPTEVILFFFFLSASLFLFFVMAPFFEIPSTRVCLLLLSVGILGTFGQRNLILSYTYASMATTAPFYFLSLILTTLMGHFYFGEAISVYTILGASLIIGGSYYIITTEKKLAEALEEASDA